MTPVSCLATLERNLARETQLFSATRVHKAQRCSMQQKTIRLLLNSLAGIEPVAEYWMPQCFQVYPQLVGTASLWDQFKTRRVVPGVMVHDAVACSGGLTTRVVDLLSRAMGPVRD